MSRHRSQVRHAPALLYAYPVEGHNALRPSGRKSDPPEIPKDSGYESMTPEEQRAWDIQMRECRSWCNEVGGYWDRVRKMKTLSPRARKRAERREAKRKH